MNRLFTFLGTNNYRTAKYALDGQVATDTPYIQEALVDLLNREEKEVDEVVVFLTKEARENNWEGEEKLKERLNRFDVKVTESHIESASSSEDVWHLYEDITRNIKEGDQIIFDITHSFRYQPMIAMLVMHFARTIKQAEVNGVYYGNFDMGQMNNPDHTHEIIDLSMIADMQDWITHAYVFSETGRADIMTKWIADEQRKIRKVEKAAASDLAPLENVTKKWMNLDQVIRTNLSLERKEAAKALLNAISAVDEEEVRPVFKPVMEVLKKSSGDFEQLADDDQLEGDLYTVKWNLELGNIQPALTIMKEITISTILEKANLPIKDRNNRDIAAQLLFLATASSVGQSKEPDSLIAWEMMEPLKLLERQSSWDSRTIERLFFDLHQRPELLKVEKELTDIRNVVNHGGFREQTPPAKKIIDRTLDYYKQYRERIKIMKNGMPEP